MPALLRFVSAFFPAWDWGYTNDLAARFAVPLDRPLNAMSAGERRKCELLLVLAQRPDLLILDDPALGLDVMVRREFLWAALEVARKEGKAVLFTSHVLTDVERVVDSVGVLDGGRLRLQAPLAELKDRFRRLVFELPGPDGPEPPRVEGELSRERQGTVLAVVTESYTPELEDRLRSREPLRAMEGLGLEDIFLALVGPRPEGKP
jgi:ABC-2 type transport system ATP-binding protein